MGMESEDGSLESEEKSGNKSYQLSAERGRSFVYKKFAARFF